jgi:drug/metabolite transporter (DMT)-like permease
MRPDRNFQIGILAGASTGIFWGVPFLAPQVLTGFSPVEIALGRFLFFGVMGFAFFRKASGILRDLSPREWMQVMGLSALGFWLYSSVLFWAIARTDGVIASLVLGLLPVTIPLFTPGKRSGGAAFHAGLLLIAAGLLVLVTGGSAGSGLLASRDPAGVAALFLCLAMWTGFAIWNSRFLAQRPGLSRRDFSSLMGAVSLVCLLPIAIGSLDLHALPERPGLAAWVTLSVILGVGSSWFANWLWNIASARLPSSISGTLLVFETVFGLLYTFLYQGRWPRDFEVLSIALCLAGVALAIRAQITS